MENEGKREAERDTKYKVRRAEGFEIMKGREDIGERVLNLRVVWGR